MGAQSEKGEETAEIKINNLDQYTLLIEMMSLQGDLMTLYLLEVIMKVLVMVMLKRNSI